MMFGEVILGRVNCYLVRLNMRGLIITMLVMRWEVLLNSYEYDAWGNVVSEREEVGNRFKFNGQQLDPITGQYYLRARFYNPVIGRFTQEDTYRGDGLNLYVYCRNNPVYYVDPTGHDSSKVNAYKDARENSISISEGGSKAEVGWDMSVSGGNINGRRYSQHAMERMAPNTPNIKAELYQRATKIAKEKGLVPQTKEYSTFIDKYVDPRNIPPSVIEDAIKNTKPIPGNRPDTFVHATDSVKVIINGNGDVITVIPK